MRTKKILFISLLITAWSILFLPWTPDVSGSAELVKGMDTYGGFPDRLASGREEKTSHIQYLPLAIKSSYTQLTVTYNGVTIGYPTYYKVIGYVIPSVSVPVYSVSIGVHLTIYPEDSDPYEYLDIREPAFPVTLPGQKNPFGWGATVGHGYLEVGSITIASESLIRDTDTLYYSLTILDWVQENYVVVGRVRNDNEVDLDGARVVVFANRCHWTEATLTSTSLDRGEETDFRVDPFYCSDETVSVVGQGSLIP